MKFDFEIRGQFEVGESEYVNPPAVAAAWTNSICLAVEHTMNRWNMNGSVTSFQTAIPGKLQEKKVPSWMVPPKVNVADVSEQGSTITIVLEVHHENSSI